MARRAKSAAEQKAIIEARIAAIIRRQEEDAAKLARMKKALSVITAKAVNEAAMARQQRLMEVGEVMEYLVGRELSPEMVRDCLSPMAEELKCRFPPVPAEPVAKGTPDGEAGVEA